jgi:drug/metabolite transporter superfamily protein YnfA
MQLQLVPKRIRLALTGKMAARWAAVRVDPRIAPSGGIYLCTDVTWVMKFEHGNYVVAQTLEALCRIRCIAVFGEATTGMAPAPT